MAPMRDGTGPQGVGRTGWGMGPCGAGLRQGFGGGNAGPVQNQMPMPGRGMGMGRRRGGRGMGMAGRGFGFAQGNFPAQQQPGNVPPPQTQQGN